MTQERHTNKTDADALAKKQKVIIIVITVITLLLVWALARSSTPVVADKATKSDQPQSPNKQTVENITTQPAEKILLDKSTRNSPFTETKAPDTKNVQPTSKSAQPLNQENPQPPPVTTTTASAAEQIENKTEQSRLTFWKSWTEQINKLVSANSSAKINPSSQEPLKINIPLELSGTAKVEVKLKTSPVFAKLENNNSSKVIGQVNTVSGIASKYEDAFSFSVNNGCLVIEKIAPYGTFESQLKLLESFTADIEQYVINGKSYYPNFTPGCCNPLEKGKGSFILKDGALKMAYKLTEEDKMANFPKLLLEPRCGGYKLSDNCKFNQDIFSFQLVNTKLAQAKQDFDKKYNSRMLIIKKMLAKEDKLTTNEYDTICKMFDASQSKLNSKKYITSSDKEINDSINDFKDRWESLMTAAANFKKIVKILEISRGDTKADNVKIYEKLQSYLKTKPESLSFSDYNKCKEVVSNYDSARRSFAQACESMQGKLQLIFLSEIDKDELETLQSEQRKISSLKVQLMSKAIVVKEIDFEQFGYRSTDD